MKTNIFLTRSLWRSLALALLIFLVSGGSLAQNGNPPSSSTPLAGNWAVKIPKPDGTFQWAYFNFKQDGEKIAGSIRVTQFYYTIKESTGGPDSFTIIGSMRDGNGDRTVKYEGKLIGDELHMSTRRRPEDKPTELIAKREPEGEGAMPEIGRASCRERV